MVQLSNENFQIKFFDSWCISDAMQNKDLLNSLELFSNENSVNVELNEISSVDTSGSQLILSYLYHLRENGYVLKGTISNAMVSERFKEVGVIDLIESLFTGSQGDK